MCEGAEKKNRTGNRRVKQSKWVFYREIFAEGWFVSRHSFFSFPHISLYKSGHRHTLKEKFSYYCIFFFFVDDNVTRSSSYFGRKLTFSFVLLLFLQSHAPTHLLWKTREAREGRVRFLLRVYRFSMILGWSNGAVKKKNLDLASWSSFGMKANRQQQETLVGCFLFSLSSLRL